MRDTNKKCADKQQHVAISTTSQKEATNGPEAKNDIKQYTLGDMSKNMVHTKCHVNEYEYEKYETYVRTSSLALFRVEAVGKLYFNVDKWSGEVERCNRLALFSSLGGYQDIKYYVYLCDHDALNPPEIGQIVDVKLHLIHIDIGCDGEYYWADSITPIDEKVEINFVENSYI